MSVELIYFEFTACCGRRLISLAEGFGNICDLSASFVVKIRIALPLKKELKNFPNPCYYHNISLNYTQV